MTRESGCRRRRYRYSLVRRWVSGAVTVLFRMFNPGPRPRLGAPAEPAALARAVRAADSAGASGLRGELPRVELDASYRFDFLVSLETLSCLGRCA